MRISIIFERGPSVIQAPTGLAIVGMRGPGGLGRSFSDPETQKKGVLPIGSPPCQTVMI